MRAGGLPEHGEAFSDGGGREVLARRAVAQAEAVRAYPIETNSHLLAITLPPTGGSQEAASRQEGASHPEVDIQRGVT